MAADWPHPAVTAQSGGTCFLPSRAGRCARDSPPAAPARSGAPPSRDSGIRPSTLPGGGGVDLGVGPGRTLVFENGLGQRLLELLERALGIALVGPVHGAIVTQLAGNDRIRSDLLGRPREQSIGLGIAAEVRFLQR